MYSDRHRPNGYSSSPDTHTTQEPKWSVTNGRSLYATKKKLIVRGKLYEIGFASTPVELLLTHTHAIR